MTDHKELCEALRSQTRDDDTEWFSEAAELIEQQAAIIAELEAAGVMTAVVFTIDGRGYGVHPNIATHIHGLQSQIKEMHAERCTCGLNAA